MSNQPNNPESLHGLAALFALGALEDGDAQRFEDHLRGGCDICAAELRRLQDVVTGIASSVAATPPPQLRDRLMARVARTPRTPGLAYNEAGLLIARSQEISWQSLAPGITYKPLYRDKARNSDTMLIRMDAGARLASHRHSQIEELFLLSGDLHVEDQVMYAGDYCRADLGSVHDASYTESGCLFLLMASPDNQFLA